MRWRISPTAGPSLTCLAALLAIVLLSGIAGAADRLLIPEQMDLPWYASGLGHSDDLAWVATVFYRPLDAVPKNVLVSRLDSYDDIDPEACPLRVEGFAVLEEGASIPISGALWNQPGEIVEICFVSSEDYIAALKDGIVTVGETKRMRSLMVGLADFYLEVNQPPDPEAPGDRAHRTVIASGLLKDGRPFFVRSAVTAGVYTKEFRFGE